MPYREIREISADADSGLLYLVVDFWLTKAGHDNGNPPFLTNDFLMQIPAQETRIVTDANGFWQRASDGLFVDPATLQPGDTTVWATETVDRPNLEVIQQVRENITNYLRWAVANRVTGDHTGDDTKPLMFNGVVQRKGRQVIRRALQDRYGLLTRRAIQGLQGQAEAVS